MCGHEPRLLVHGARSRALAPGLLPEGQWRGHVMRARPATPAERGPGRMTWRLASGTSPAVLSRSLRHANRR